MGRVEMIYCRQTAEAGPKLSVRERNAKKSIWRTTLEDLFSLRVGYVGGRIIRELFQNWTSLVG